MSADLDGSVALVTGASRGIGAAVAIALGKLGARVVITARTQGGLEETDDAIRAAGSSATILPLDLRDGEKIDVIGPTIYQRFGRLDILVHAAGALGKLTPVGHIQPNDWADVVGVNLSAAWRLIRTCDPLLRAAEAGRGAFLTEERAREPRAYWGAMGATKAAMEHLVQTWAFELVTTRVKVNLVDPGRVATRMRAGAFPGEDPTSLPSPASVAPAIARLCMPDLIPNGTIIRVGPNLQSVA